MKYTKSDFELSNGVKFSIIHNLPEQFGLSINNALDNWLMRTNDYDAKSFVNYIRSKDTGFEAYTENEFEKLKPQS